MNSIFTYSLIAALGLLPCVPSFGQGRKQKPVCDFVPYGKVIFQDDFTKDYAGSFPAKWEVPQDLRRSGWNVKVMEHPDGNFMAASTYPSNTATLSIEPKVNDFGYLSDSFTLEFEFYLETKAAKIDIDFYSSTSENAFELIFHTLIKKEKKTYQLEYERWFNTNLHQFIPIPDSFIYNTWHKFAISYAQGIFKCYLEGNRQMEVDGHDHPLTGLFFSFSSSVNIKNIRLATGYPAGAMPHIDRKPVVPIATHQINETPVTPSPLNQILTGNKFVTHAINFDVGKATIRPESMEFIVQLATFLINNPEINLEIDGHTDSDGEPSANLVLSQARADAVKDQLIAQSIDADRLTTKGFGASAPIKPNTTPEGKAENRRVEFIKL